MDYFDVDNRGPMRSWVPLLLREKIAVFSLLSGIPILIIFELLVVYPAYYHSGYWSIDFAWHLFWSLFIGSNVYANLIFIMSTDVTGRRYNLPHTLSAGWKYCYICKLNAPPRAYHCHICNACILRRDHHCTFTGCCIGYHNQRYYLMSVIYAWIGAVYAVWFHWSYIWEAVGGVRLVSVWALFMPQFAFLFGKITLVQFFLSGIQMATLLACVYSTYLSILQIVLVVRGQTFLEFTEGNCEWDMGWRRNVRDVLGKKWKLAWISPLMNSPLEGDGLKFGDAAKRSHAQSKAM